MKCPNCGVEIANDSLFCENCGAKITASKEPSKKKWLPWAIGGAIVGVIVVILIILLSGKKEANPIAETYIDLGLPSGTLWKDVNEDGGLYKYSETSKFSNRLPTIDQIEELKKFCYWEYDWERKGYKVVGRNGNSMFLPAEGYYEQGKVKEEGEACCYWTERDEWFMIVYYNGINLFIGDSDTKNSVRLVQKQKNIPQARDENGYVNLGLYSGSIWKERRFDDEASDIYTYDEAKNKFGRRLPTKEQWEELMRSCTWFWTGYGYTIIGKNGNNIFLPNITTLYDEGGVYDLEHQPSGCYWSATPDGAKKAFYMHAYAGWTGINSDSRNYKLAVNLVMDNFTKEEKKVVTPTASKSKNDNYVEEEEPEDVVFVVVEKMPEFPGGAQAMHKFLAENVKYPVIAQENGIQGRVVCQFTVNKDGSLVDIEVVRSGGDQSLDKEAVRVIKSMPKWKPGTQRGRAVRVKYTIPVDFKLQ